AKLRPRRQRGALVAVVLRRPVRPPLRRVGVVLADVDEANERRALLTLALEDVDEERRDDGGRARGSDGAGEERGAAAARAGGRGRHGLLPWIFSSSRRGPPSPARSPCPTEAWQWTHWTASRSVRAPATSSWTIGSWQCRQFSCRMAAFGGVMRI